MSSQRLVGFGAAFYGVLGIAGWLLLGLVDDSPNFGIQQICAVNWIGVAAATLVVCAFNIWWWRRFAWAREMRVLFRESIGSLTVPAAVCLALFSGVAEEIFFRGFLQSWLGPVVATIAFGLVHMLPDKRARPWPLFAFLIGAVYATSVELSGSLAPAVASHVAINGVGLIAISRTNGTD